MPVPIEYEAVCAPQHILKFYKIKFLDPLGTRTVDFSSFSLITLPATLSSLYDFISDILNFTIYII
jgi:hypothetical protein